MDFEILDFHTHPFSGPHNNICQHREYCAMSPEKLPGYLQGLGISQICGSVIQRQTAQDTSVWDTIRRCNDTALELARVYGGFYIPGFHVHPDFVEESCREIEDMARRGLRLIGELVPYYHGWEDYSCRGMDAILELAGQYHMIVSFHSMGEDQMDSMVKKHPDVTFVAAHPGEYGAFMRHLQRMKYSENYYLDLSGTGLFRHGLLRHGIDRAGAERFLFGTDYPVCNPAMYVGGVVLDSLLSDWEKERILSGNARRLLGLED